MTDRYLVTPSLYSSWRYWRESEESEKQQFLDTLTKKPFEANENMKRGQQVEADVVTLCAGGILPTTLSDEYRAVIENIALRCRGGLWQQKIYLDLTIGSRPYLLYGKADNMLRKTVRDIKYTSGYDIGKYNNSIQHGSYLVASGLPEFIYTITDGRNIFEETYHLESGTRPKLEADIAEMMAMIWADSEFAEAYEAHWGPAGSQARQQAAVNRVEEKVERVFGSAKGA